MIYTVIADISRFDADKFLSVCECYSSSEDIKKGEVNPLPSADYSVLSIRQELVDHIKSASDTRLRKERCGAYLLLSAVVSNVIGFMPPVLLSQNGKPYFDRDFGIYFNISHTTDLVAVSISDEGSVGVDAEAEIAPERAARLESRFFSEISISERPLDVEYAFCKISDDGNIRLLKIERGDFSETHSEGVEISRVTGSYSFGARWTIYEASLKCNGGGFTSLPCLGMLLLETKADTVRVVTMGGEFFITTSSV